MNGFRKLLVPFRQSLPLSLLGLMTLAIPLLFSMATYEKFEIIKLAIWLILLGWAVAAYAKKLGGGSVEGTSRVISKPLLLAATAFLIWAVLATVFSWDHLNSVLGFYPRFTNGLLFFILFVGYTLLASTEVPQERFHWLLEIVVFDSLVISAVGILQSMGVAFYTGLDEQGFLRAPSLLGNPNFSTMFLAAIIPLTFFLLMRARSFGQRLYYGLVVFVDLWCIVLLSSRGAWVALAAGLFVFFVLVIVFLPKKAYIALIATFIVVAAGLWYAFLPVTRPTAYNSVLNFSETNVNLRLYVWNIARVGIIEHPVTGVGLGNFQLLFEQNRGSNLAAESGVYDDAHNLFLQLAATGGIPLAIFFIILIGTGIFFAFRNFRKTRDLSGAALVAALIAWSVAAAFTPVSTACFLLLGLLLAGCFYNSPAVAIWKRPLLWKRGLLFAGGGLAIVIGLIFITSELLFYQGYTAYFQNDWQRSLRLTNAAIHLNPSNQYYYMYRAASEGLLGDGASMERDIRTVSALHPREARSYVAVSNIYYTLYSVSGKPSYLQAAADQMYQALQRDSLYADRYGNEALLYFFEGKTAAALAFVKVSLTLDPQHLPSWMLLARLYQVQNERTQMLYALNQAFHVHPDIPLLKLVLERAKTTTDMQKIFIPVGFMPTTLE